MPSESSPLLKSTLNTHPNPVPHLSPWEKLDIVPALFKTFGAFLYGLAAAPLRGSSGASTGYLHAVFTAVRTSFARLSVRQIIWMNPTTEQLYLDICKDKDIVPQIVSFDSGAAGYWIGDPKAENVILYCHGGGYVIHSFPGQYYLCFNIVSTLSLANKSASVLYLDYTLAPNALYPTQLTQAMDCLSYLLKSRLSSNIILSGDAAGGNLVFAMLAHIALPHPDPQVPRLHLSSPLKAAFSIAPWVSLGSDADSFKRNLRRDYAPASAVHKFADLWLGGGERDPYNEPINAPEGFWGGLDGVVGSVLFVVGGHEAALDDVERFGRIIGASHKNTSTMIVPGEYHIAPAINPYIGIKKESVTEKTVKEWLLKQF